MFMIIFIFHARIVLKEKLVHVWFINTVPSISLLFTRLTYIDLWWLWFPNYRHELSTNNEVTSLLNEWRDRQTQTKHDKILANQNILDLGTEMVVHSNVVHTPNIRPLPLTYTVYFKKNHGLDEFYLVVGKKTKCLCENHLTASNYHVPPHYRVPNMQCSGGHTSDHREHRGVSGGQNLYAN
jgi:hypothetical protein